MVPLYLHRDAVAQGRYTYIICTQPRRVAAIALANRVAHLLGEEVGQTVGYRLEGGTKQEHHGKTRILFVTTGYLLENLSHRHEGGLWSRATHIVLDEVHERSLESDMMMLVVRLLLQQEDDEGGVAPHRAKRLILMSATISMTLFQNYFSSLSYPTKSGPEQRAAQRTATIEPAVEQVEDPLPQLEDSAVAHSAVAQQDILPTDHAANNDRGVAPQLAVVDPSARREDPPLAAPSSVGVSANPPEIPVVTAGERPKKVSIYLLPTIISGVSRLYPTFPREALDTLAAYAARCDRAKSAAALQLSPKEVKSMCQLILIHAKPASCILVFLPGLKEIEDFFQAITDLGPSDSLSLRLLVLHSIISQDDQNQIFVPAGKNECKIILSTNIAETSITIKDVKVVVDLGFVRRVVYDTKKHAKTIRTEWCSVAACVQRGGRAGRVTDGMNLRFYTEHVYVKLMPVFDESVLFPLEASILKFRLHFAHLGAVEDLFAQLIEPPAERKMRQTLTRLVRFGALGPAPEYEVLDFGRIAADLPVDIKFSRAIVLASRYGLAGEMAVIAAGHMLTYSLYQQPRRSACKNDAQFQAWMMETFTSMHHFDGGRCNDPLQFLSIMEAALAVRDDQIRRTFCYRHKLEFRQVTSLIDTTRLICTRIRESTAMAQLNFTANDIALMDALRSPTTTQRVRFASLAPQSRTVDHLLIVLTACADSVIGGVRATPSMHEILAGPDSFLNNTNRNTALSWAQSTKNDVIIFSEISRPVYDAGEAGFLECLRCFGASAVVFLAKGHGVYGAAVQMPRLADTHSATGSSAAPKTSPGVNAICRMKLLHKNGKWSFSSRHFEGLLVLQPKTSNMVQTLWRSMTLAAESRPQKKRQDQQRKPPSEPSDGDEVCSEDGEEAGHEEAEEEEEMSVLTNDAAKKADNVFHWTRRLRIDKWSSVGSHLIGSPFSSPALLGVAFTHNYLGGVPVATCNFLFPTEGSIKVLSFLAALVHLPPTWTVTLAKGRDNSGVSIIKLFSEDVHVDDVLRLLTPPIYPISLLEVNLHRLTLHMLTNAFTRSPASYLRLCEVRLLLRTLREEGEKKFLPMAGKVTRDNLSSREWDVELTSQIFGAPAAQVEIGHDVLAFVDIGPLVVDAALAACPRWRRAVEAYRQCMNLLETTDGVCVTLPQLPQCDSVPSPSDDPNERPIGSKKKWADCLRPAANDDVREVADVVPPAATAKPLQPARDATKKNVVAPPAAATKAPLQPTTNVPPREFRLGAQVIPITELIHNKFVEDCIQYGTNVGRLCIDRRSHSRMTCRFAHFDRYDMKDGGTVNGCDLLDNVALQNLRGNTNFTGCLCPKKLQCPDPMKCTYLHRK
ncbi:DEAD/DEAH box RNA helicase, putative [Bodo saltans]|uniref:DEAD/DEAH box RNA helicase, putative n=1 Tax=Bodo saltans TaxID=75058 RepID=A0A0S4IW96_BODSA|nr:DEAD/DEAH box RNA helicase, putative [Bodo saltans]|eukprot:CUG05530.1 DEAD/DEAH box RNA helicase, putative [Bodo saltans]